MSLAVTSPAPEEPAASADIQVKKPIYELRFAHGGILRVQEKTYTNQRGEEVTLLRVLTKQSQGELVNFCRTWLHNHSQQLIEGHAPPHKLGVLGISTIKNYYSAKVVFYAYDESRRIDPEGVDIQTGGQFGIIIDVREVTKKVVCHCD